MMELLWLPPSQDLVISDKMIPEAHAHGSKQGVTDALLVGHVSCLHRRAVGARNCEIN